MQLCFSTHILIYFVYGCARDPAPFIGKGKEKGFYAGLDLGLLSLPYMRVDLAPLLHVRWMLYVISFQREERETKNLSEFFNI
jgi:hypothetical protein